MTYMHVTSANLFLGRCFLTFFMRKGIYSFFFFSLSSYLHITYFMWISWKYNWKLTYTGKQGHFAPDIANNDLTTRLPAMCDLLTFTSDHQQVHQYRWDSPLPTQASGVASASHPCCLFALHWPVTSNEVTTETSRLANQRTKRLHSKRNPLSWVKKWSQCLTPPRCHFL